jgi:hypothetical protein
LSIRVSPFQKGTMKTPTQFVLPILGLLATACVTGGGGGFTPEQQAAFFAGHQQRMHNGPAATMGAPTGPTSASEVCDRITMSETRLQCVRGSANRSYTSDELRTCANMMMNEQKRDCMLSGGTTIAGQPPSPTTGSVAVAQPPSPTIGSPAQAEAPVAVRPLRLMNFFRLAVTRVVWRPTNEVRFRELPLRRPLTTSTTVDLEVGRGRIDFCYQFDDGTRVFSTNMDDTLPSFLIPNNESRQQPGACVDTL